MHTRAEVLPASVAGSGTPLLRLARRWLMPEGAILVGAIALVTVPSTHAALESAAPFLARTVFAAALLLSWRFHRSRAALAVLLLALTHFGLERIAGGFGQIAGASGMMFGAVALLLPVNLLGVTMLGERGVFTIAGLLRLAIVGVQVIVVAALPFLELGVTAAWLTHDLVPWSLSALTSLPQPAVGAFGVAVVVLAIELMFRDGGMARVFLWVLFPCALAFHAMPDLTAAATYLGAAGLMFAVWVVDATYFMAYRDGLTELPGRRAFNEALEGLAYPYTVAMIDVDHFKRFNDEHGHDVGDQVLRMVAGHLERVGGGGQAYRYGGEEFAIVFPGRRRDDCLPYLRTVHRAVRESEFTVRDRRRPRRKPSRPRRSKAKGRQLAVTVSVGLAEPAERGAKADQVLRAADQALYRAKRAGRDRIRR